MDTAPLVFDSETSQRSFSEGYRMIKYVEVSNTLTEELYIVKVLSVNALEIARTLLKSVDPVKASFIVSNTSIRFDVESIKNLLGLDIKSNVMVYVITTTDDKGDVLFDVFDPSMNKSTEQEEKCERLKQLLNLKDTRYIEEMTSIARSLFPGTIDRIDQDKHMISGASPSINGDAFDFGSDSIRFYTTDGTLTTNAYVPPEEKLGENVLVPDITKNVFGPWKT